MEPETAQVPVDSDTEERIAEILSNMTPEEKAVYDRMKRSPYRSYLDGDICAPEEIVYFKLIASDERVAAIRAEIADLIEETGLRTAVRPQPSSPGASGLYVYSGEATVPKAEERLMAYA